MSVQYRSRIRTVADYSSEVSDIGSCCYHPEHEDYDPDLNATPNISYQDCISQGGYFVPTAEGGICPNLSQKGCCCACSFVDDFEAFLAEPGLDNGVCFDDSGIPSVDPLDCYQGGLREVSFCECNDLGGIWSEEPCSNFTGDGNIYGGAHVLCNPAGQHEDGTEIPDVRYPGACCSPNIDGGCANVCSFQECLELDQDSGEGIFYESYNCSDDIECGTSNYRSNDDEERDRRTGLIIGDKLTQQRIREIYNSTGRGNSKVGIKSACSYYDGNDLKCEVLSESNCDTKKGIWSGLDTGGRGLLCGDSGAEDIKNFVKNDRSSIDSGIVDSWSIGQKVLDSGVYVGRFYPQSRTHGSGVVCKGNPNTGPVSQYTSVDVDEKENSNKQYAIVLYPNDIYNKKYSTTKTRVQANSVWDSIENNTKNGTMSLTKEIKMLDSNKYTWYVPSLDVMSFIFEQIDSTEFLTNLILSDTNPSLVFRPLKTNAFYWTSSVVKRTKGKYFYIHSGNFVASCESNKKHPVRLVQMIPIN